jgi:hypothetical protein
MAIDTPLGPLFFSRAATACAVRASVVSASTWRCRSPFAVMETARLAWPQALPGEGAGVWARLPVSGVP